MSIDAEALFFGSRRRVCLVGLDGEPNLLLPLYFHSIPSIHQAFVVCQYRFKL